MAVCKYGFEDDNYIDRFLETNANSHKQVFNQLKKGNYTIYVICTDAAGNNAKGQTSFNLELDTKEPWVTRLLYSGGKLLVVTDEDARCYYKNETNSLNEACNFNYEEANEMEGNSRQHSTQWVENMNYYIKCKDIWDNEPDECSIIARPYKI